jgi:uncharacterized protein (TIGR02271 family)
MQKSVIGFFDDSSQAEKAKTEIKALGLPESDMDILSADTSMNSEETNRLEDISFGERIRRFFARFGNHNDVNIYAEGVRRGGVTLSVKADDDRMDKVREILERNGAVDIDRKAQYFKEGGFTNYDYNLTPLSNEESKHYLSSYSDWERNNFADSDIEQVIPVVEEKVNVGKRAVEKGRVRIYTHVTETPIDKDLRLRDETIEVDRKRVDRPINSNDMSAFKEGEIELRETSEEPLIEKEARVIEEVRVRKDAKEHTEHVHETARRTDVKVDRSSDLKGEKRP